MQFTPADLNRIIVVVTACLCFLGIVSLLLVLGISGKLDPKLVGTYTAGGTSTGLVAFAFLIVWLLRPLLANDAKDGDGSGEKK